jgi:hypothetical protein
MNRKELDMMLVASRPETGQQRSAFTDKVMSDIQDSATFGAQMRTTSKRSRRSLLMKIRALHGAGLAVAIVLAVLLLGGVAYASARFVPDLIQLVGKQRNSNGRTQYTVPAFGDCYGSGEVQTDKFEVMAPMPLSDNDVQKTLQAKCELTGMNAFVDATWPTYGQHKVWQDGDTIYYTRPDRLGVVEQVSSQGLVLRFSSRAGDTKTYATFEGQSLQVYSHGQMGGLSQLQKGDYVFSVVRATETYRRNPADKIGEQPVERGLVAVVRMSQPERYYKELQQYVRPVMPCQGNPQERCTDGPAGSGIDVYSRQMRVDDTPLTAGQERLDVAGAVTAITPDSFVLKASSGALYTVRLPKTLIDDYNQTVAPQYDELLAPNTDKVRLHINSWVMVSYAQAKSANRQDVATDELVGVLLLTELPPK